ncbi:MAG: HAD-IA family hydrolase [Deltaproteobacteria bacterium]|nr:HAD-IA family hydrolase [Deltaproteobacteria bacterium]
MNLKQFKVLSFDVVGTLIDFERGMLNYLRGSVPGASVTDEAFLEAYRQSRTSDAAGPYPDDLVRAWGDVAKATGLPDTQELAEGFRKSVSEWPAFADSVESLMRLRRRYKLVGMTNTRRWAVKYFERTLGQPFDDMVTADEALCEKPDPQFFAYTRGRLSTRGFTLNDTLHVAQSQFHDIGVARRLGYKVCWIERRQGQAGFGATKAVSQLTKPDYHFRTLESLSDAVDAAFAG